MKEFEVIDDNLVEDLANGNIIVEKNVSVGHETIFLQICH